MSARTVMIVTNKHDVHADRVAERLSHHHVESFRLDWDRFPRDYAIDLRAGDDRLSGEIVDAKGGVLDLDTLVSVWMRKGGTFRFKSGLSSAQERLFAKGESEQILFGLLASLDCFWMSRPDRIRAANWKVEQLQRAARLGFAIPDFVVTNDPAKARDFCRAHEQVIFKSLYSTRLAGDQVSRRGRNSVSLPTTLIERGSLDMLDAVSELPCFFQRYVDKSYDFRVTIVDDRVFTARIHSQDDPRTKIDSRDISAPVRYEPFALPDRVIDLSLALLRSYGLSYGALDIVQSRDGDYYFLENNPCGQYLYVEELVKEFDITGAVADRLRAGLAG